MTFDPPIRWKHLNTVRLVVEIIDCGHEIVTGYPGDEADVWMSEIAKSSIREALSARQQHELANPEYYRERWRATKKYYDEALF